MALERTLSIIKPDATKRNLTGKINAKFEDAGLRIVAQKRIHLTKAQAGEFYKVHAERPFYGELVRVHGVCSRSWCRCWKARGAIAKNREVMGATNPADAGAGHDPRRIRRSVGENSVHGSDAPETAAPKSRISSRVSSWSADRNQPGNRKTQGPCLISGAAFFIVRQRLRCWRNR